MTQGGTLLGSHLIRILAICCLGTVLYSNALNAPFVFDDLPNVEAQPAIRLRELSLDGLLRAGFGSLVPTRPVANVSFALNYYFGQYKVTGYHLVNLAIHLANGTLVYLLALILFRQQFQWPGQGGQSPPASAVPAMALFAAMVFTAHPVQTQSVTYIVQRMNSLAVMFLLLALLLYIRGRLASRNDLRWALYGGCAVSWALGLGSKEIAAIFPVIVWIYEWCFPGNLSKEWLKRNLKYPLGAMILLGAVAPFYINKTISEGAAGGLTFGERNLTQFRVVMFYISLLLYPHPGRLNLLHDFNPSRSLLQPITTLFSILGLVSLIGLTIYLARRHRLLSFCVLWVFATLAIESGSVALDWIELVYEHRLYLSMVGVAFMASQALFSLTAGRPTLRRFVGVLLIALLGTGTYVRNRVWQDPITLWSDVVAKNSESFQAHNNLGIALAGQGRLEEAARHYAVALRLEPDQAEAHNNLGLALQRLGRPEDAIREFSEAVRIDPKSAPARNNLGLVLESRGRLEEAARHLTEALRIDPSSAAAHNNLGHVLRRLGKIDDAIRYFTEALQIDPTNAAAHNNLGLCLAVSGRLDDAAQQYGVALSIQPDFAEAHNNRGEIRVRQGRLDEAMQDYSEALRINPRYALAHNNLGVVLARQGRFEEAIGRFSTALDLDPGQYQARANLAAASEVLRESTSNPGTSDSP